MMLLLRALMLVVTVTVSVKAHCFAGKVSETEGGRCQYLDTVWDEGHTMIIDCYNCTCHANYYACCGVGHKAGVGAVPDGMTLVKEDDCSFHFEPTGDTANTAV